MCVFSALKEIPPSSALVGFKWMFGVLLSLSVKSSVCLGFLLSPSDLPSSRFSSFAVRLSLSGSILETDSCHRSFFLVPVLERSVLQCVRNWAVAAKRHHRKRRLFFFQVNCMFSKSIGFIKADPQHADCCLLENRSLWMEGRTTETRNNTFRHYTILRLSVSKLESQA